MANKKIIIINGPNLNLLGLIYYQSNHEGDIIDQLHLYGFNSDGIIINAGAYTHTSIAIADAISAIQTPAIEVHISDINKREEFRKHSYLTAVCKDHVIGKGLDGYKEALQILLQ